MTNRDRLVLLALANMEVIRLGAELRRDDLPTQTRINYSRLLAETIHARDAVEALTTDRGMD